MVHPRQNPEALNGGISSSRLEMTAHALAQVLLTLPDLPVAIQEGHDEYWGDMVTRPAVVETRTLQVNGPKEAAIPCIFIGV